MKINSFKNRRGISPIIATLLLILIAIAAGVIVYAYVVGFIGNSTSNSGGTTATLSIDQLYVASATSSYPVTAYLRNLGPSIDSFNTGFYVKSSALNDQLDVAVSITDAAAGDKITNVTLAGTGVAGQVAVSLTFSACTPGTAKVVLLGLSSAAAASLACVVGVVTANTGTIVQGFTFTNEVANTRNALGNVTFAAVTLSTTPTVIGVPFNIQASMSLGVNSVGTLTLCTSGPLANPLVTKGTSYSFSVTGTDGATATASAKSS